MGDCEINWLVVMCMVVVTVVVRMERYDDRAVHSSRSGRGSGGGGGREEEVE